MQNKIITERLNLNLLTLDDCDFVKRLVNTDGWIEFIGNRHVCTNDDAIAYVSKILNTENLFYWVVKLKDNSTPVGIISFIKRSYLENFDIGFDFFLNFLGRVMHAKPPKKYYH